jgi:ABC-type branched-subunit amino acid transport system substrate-binding protein
MNRFVAAAIALGVVVVAAGGAAAGTERSSSRSAGYTLRIGDIVPLTGQQAIFGPAYAKASGLAVQQATKALRQAGISDVKIQIEHADDGTTAEGAVAAARKLIANGAGCILGTLLSGNSIAVANAATVPAQVVQIAPNNSSTALTTLADNGYFFRVMPSDALQAPILAKVILQEMGKGATISVAARNDAFGAGLAPRLAAALTKAGLDVKGPLMYDPTAPSYESEARQIVSGNPDAYAIIDIPGNFAKLAPPLLRTGQFNGRKLFLAGGWPATIPSTIPGAALEGARGTVAGTPLGTRAADAFDALYKSTGGAKDRQTLEVNNFDGAMICILASIAANSGKGSSIVKQIQRVASPPGPTYTFLNLAQAIKALKAGKDINYEGAGGADDLDANGDPKAAIYNVYTYRDGKQTVLRQVRIRK